MKPGVRNTDTSDFYIIYIPKFRRNSSKSVGHQGYFVYYQNEHTWETHNMDMESSLVIFTNQDKPCELLSTKYDNTVNKYILFIKQLQVQNIFYVSDVDCNNQKCADLDWRNVHESLGIQNYTRYLGCIIYIFLLLPLFLLKKS